MSVFKAIRIGLCFVFTCLPIWAFVNWRFHAWSEANRTVPLIESNGVNLTLYNLLGAALILAVIVTILLILASGNMKMTLGLSPKIDVVKPVPKYMDGKTLLVCMAIALSVIVLIELICRVYSI